MSPPARGPMRSKGIDGQASVRRGRRAVLAALLIAHKEADA